MKVLFLFVFILTLPKISWAFMKQPGQHTFMLGAGNLKSHKDYNDYGEDGVIPDFSYSYGRENTFFPLLNLHAFKRKIKANRTYFSSKSVNFSFGYNLLSFDSFNFSGFAGLGFYIPRAERQVNGVLTETEAKLVFGANLGIDSFLKLNEKNGMGFRYHYHNPFNSKQEVGGKLSGHYSIMSVYYAFLL